MLKYLIIICIIPLGLISKLLFGLHTLINDVIIHYGAILKNSYVKRWTEIFNIESKDGTWEIINGVIGDNFTKELLDYKYGDDLGVEEENKIITFMYFTQHENEPKVKLYLNEKEFQDLLDFTSKLNKKVIKK